MNFEQIEKIALETTSFVPGHWYYDKVTPGKFQTIKVGSLEKILIEKWCDEHCIPCYNSGPDCLSFHDTYQELYNVISKV